MTPELESLHPLTQPLPLGRADRRLRTALQQPRPTSSPPAPTLPTRLKAISVPTAIVSGASSCIATRTPAIRSESREATRQQQQQHEIKPKRMAGSQGEHDDNEGEFDDVEDEEEYPAIEGCTDEDAGWMKVQLVGLMPDFYANLRDPNL
ncbi:hypothetical protein F4820DRAFT_447818 [Hypoxylon rubiginosum]|uniref:Uncharacterized protein n=1 Tax=Hypoxylon rubiginosum TaxID=110542 RepID=A0ACB9Z1G9_9PEZI|nr:hypothetical protein F4820DRAFT_447818 [Hypoxylon rubiginosum]